MGEISKRQRVSVSDQDKISNLPPKIIDLILSSLPFGDAARTCVLSRNWRHKWSKLPYLVFEYDSCSSNFKRNLDSDSAKFSSIVDHVLLLHRGPILKFDLTYDLPIPESIMDRWIIHLSRNPIKELELKVHGNKYSVPACLFACQTLTSLVLHYCSTIKIPLAFKGFINLKSLCLHFRTMAEDDLKYMISSCPALERLTLGVMDELSHITVTAPNLIYFILDGNVKGVSFENTFRLAEVTLACERFLLGDDIECWTNPCNFLEFCAQLPTIQTLEIDAFYLECLAFGASPSELPISCTNLDSLTLEIVLNNAEDCLSALCILSIFRKLRKLIIVDISSIESEVTVRESDTLEDNFLSGRFTKLKFVKITSYYIPRTHHELGFVNFMLSKSPVLEEMVVKPRSDRIRNDNDIEDDDDNRILSFVKKLLSLRRVSNRARIVFEDK